ncbi:MAG: polyribonucleotide nucleotidyltransferase, partial [Verrucomicrobiia bacterium]
MSATTVTASIGGKEISIETGKIAKQADGAVIVTMGETIILVAACAAHKSREGQDFFPLTVDYREKASAAGRFPGGYFKREGRPSEKEILTMRLTDRPIRPLFPKGWFNEVQVQTLLLSADGENEPDVMSILGASAALTVSDIPWAGPLGCVRVGRVDGEFIANPTHSEAEGSDLDLIYVGNKDDVVMFEGCADEIADEDFDKALEFAQEAIQPQIVAQNELREKAGKVKREIKTLVVKDEILADAKEWATGIGEALLTPEKLKREKACSVIKDEVKSKLIEKYGAAEISGQIMDQTFYGIQKAQVRHFILNEGKRQDGRGFDDIRALSSEISVLPRTHGSAIFTRGETQALSLCTLGTTDDSQDFDSYTGGVDSKQFMLHYNFPHFSVGETGRIMGPGRREIGHGALAERSVRPVIPFDDFPYAVRIVSEIMESNGSTSMAAVCSASLALMDAGVPITSPVGGISIGICTETAEDGSISQYQILNDIIGWEDAFCDMDCKIAGTTKGITGFQLDLKLKGLPSSIMTEALAVAKAARLKIIDSMNETIDAPKTEMSQYAPRIVTVNIKPDKIGALIGPGGKNIKRICDESGCEINIEDDGTVRIYSTNADGLAVAQEQIEGLCSEPEVGKIYRGRVVT